MRGLLRELRDRLAGVGYVARIWHLQGSRAVCDQTGVARPWLGSELGNEFGNELSSGLGSLCGPSFGTRVLWRRLFLILGLVSGLSCLSARHAEAQFGCYNNVTITPCGSGKTSAFGVKDSVLLTVWNNTWYARWVSMSIYCPNSSFYPPYSDLIYSCALSHGGSDVSFGTYMNGEDSLQIWVVYQLENPLLYQGQQTISIDMDGIDLDVLVSARRFTVTPDPGQDSHLSSLCVADCFNAKYAQSTVGYRSRDSSRVVTLVYNGETVNPQPFLFTAVRPVKADSLTGTLKLDVMIDSVSVPFLNGDTSLYFSGISPPSPSYDPPHSARLGGQMNLSGYTTGVHLLTFTVTDADYDAVYSAYFGAMSSAVNADTKVVVVNGSESSIAKGWGIAGLQRVYALDDTDFVVIDGDGSYTRFQGSNNGYYGDYGTAGPAVGAADFSRLGYWGSGDSTYGRTYQNGTVIYYNAAGYMTSVVDGQSGLRTEYQYESWAGGQRLIKILDPYWKIGGNPAATVLSYGTYGLASVTEPGSAGRTTHLTVNSSGHLTTWSDPDSVTTTFAYDDSVDRLSSVTDRRGGVRHFYYDTATALIDSMSGPTFAVDQGGGTTASGTPVTHFKPWQPIGVPNTHTSIGSPASLLDTNRTAVVKGPLGDSTLYVLDFWGQALKTTDPLGQVTSSTRVTRPYYYYDPYGDLYVDTVSAPFAGTVTHPDETTDYYWYSFGWGGVNLVHKLVAGQSDVYYHYLGDTPLIDSIGGSGVQPARYYYSLPSETYSLPDSVTTYTMIYYMGDSAAVPATQHFTYDSVYHRLKSSTDELGNTTTYTYDSVFGNLSAKTSPGSRTTTMTFDSHGRDSVAHVPAMADVRTTYDLMDRVATMAVLTGTPVVTTYKYDALYDTAVVDGLGNHYVTDRDALGHATREYAANSSTSYRSYRYDLAGRLSSMTNRRGQSVSMTYDALGRPTGHGGSGIVDSLKYDLDGPDGQQFVTWDSVARDSISGTQADAARTGVATITHFKTDPSVDFRTIQSAHDDWTYQDSIVVESQDSNLLPTITYTKTPWILGGSSISIDGAVHTTRYFDLKQRLTSESYNGMTVAPYTTGDRPVQLSFSGTGLDSIFRVAYAYDSTNRVSAAQQGGGHLQRQFKYDSLGRLSAVEYRTQSCATWPGSADADYGWLHTCVTPADSTQSYSYDVVGNRTDALHSYGDGNQMLRFGKWTFTYDYDGNLTEKTDTTTGHNWHYGWDAVNRLTWVKESGGDSVHYDYDVSGHLVRRKTNGAIDRHWLYIGDHIMSELDDSLRPLVQYTYYSGMDHPHAAVIFGGGSYEEHDLLQDELGNVVGAVEGGSSVKQRVDYDPWGKATYRVSLSGNGLLWKGLRYEGGSTGLYYVRNRWYDPDVGRFISEDPSGLQGGMNMYAFGANDPINFSDPSGLKVCVSGSGDINALKNALGDATDTNINWDSNNCVDGFNSRGHLQFDLLRDGFRHMAFSSQLYTVQFSSVYGSIQGDPYVLSIYEYPEVVPYRTGPWGRCTGGTAQISLGQLVAHELWHHIGVQFGYGLNSDEVSAVIQGDNVYNSFHTLPNRCAYP